MKSNVIPALIVAVALIACAVFVRQAITTSAGSQFDAVLTRMEESTKKQTDGSDSRVTTVIKGFSRSVADGFKSGLNEAAANPDQQSRTQQELKIRDLLVVREVKFVASQQKAQERVIGILKNGSDVPLNNIQLSILYRNKDGTLLDLGSAYVRGLLRPGEESGFEATRSLGEYNEQDEVLAQRKASSVNISVVSFNKG
ncbi:MAG: FxLYD domain-containing protein [Opitutaceae bacterium]